MKDIEQPFDGAFDVIVVGAGSAGCALAGRLAERGDLTVALLEAGGYDRNPWIHIPLGYGKLFENADLVWTHRTQPSPTLQGRSLYQPRGRLLGGTGSINGMTYMRGDAAVYDGWAAAGNPGWSYADVLPLFRAAETNVRGADATHGDAGPIGVSEARRHPIVDAFIAAGGAAGAPRREDFNGPVNEGVGYFQFTLRDGRRNSSVRYLRGSRPTLDLKTRFVARRILFDGRRAIGVEGAMGRRSVRLRARREIVLSAGSFGSPHLLQLSGVGPGPLLQSLGLPVLRDNAAVGANYQDHFDAGLVAACREPITLNDDLKQLHRRVLMGLRYALCRSGPMATTGVLGGGFFRLDPASPMTDCQINLGLWSTQRDGTVQNAPLLDPFSAFRFTVVDLKPDARGAVTAASPDPDASPRIAIDFLATERDQAAFVRMIRFARGLMASPALARFYDHEVRPGPDVASDEDILVFGRRFGRANHHAVGTCRMGSGDDAVVDSRLKVHGVEGLRVADGSIMPSIPNGNTNAACVMIGEKAARLIAEDMAA